MLNGQIKDERALQKFASEIFEGYEQLTAEQKLKYDNKLINILDNNIASHLKRYSNSTPKPSFVEVLDLAEFIHERAFTNTMKYMIPH